MTARSVAPVVVLVLVCGALAAAFRDERSSSRDDQVFLQAAYLMREESVSPIEAITRAAGIQYGWGGALAERLRARGDIQTYALLPAWSAVGDFRTGPSPTGRALYVESTRLRWASFALFAAAVVALYWALIPAGRGVAFAAALLLALGHPFRHGPTLFDPWVMPLAVAAVGCFVRGRHLFAAALVVAAVVVKPNYVFLLPAMALAALVRPRDVRAAAVHAGAVVVVVALYLALAAVHVIAAGEYAAGVRGGYDPGVLAYSTVETVSYTYRAAVVQGRDGWPLFPWTAANGAALAWLAVAVRRGRVPARLALLVAGMIAVPLLANFTVLGSIEAYEDGGHFRWVNVSIIGVAIGLALGYRELASALSRRWRSA